MAKSKHYHVTPSSDGWSTRRAGSERAAGVFPIEREAIQRGRELAQETKGELRIHGQNGKIREGWSYGNDPYPPKG